MEKPLHTVVETAEFLSMAKRARLGEQERVEILDHLARNPNDGTPLGGGLFKLRFARPGSGKRGGLRTVHYFRDENLPVFLLAVYAKNAKENLSRAHQNEVASEAERIGKTYGDTDE